MISNGPDVPACLEHSPVRVVFRSGAVSSLGEEVARLGAKRVLLVTDPGIRKAGHAGLAEKCLMQRGIECHLFDEVEENPTTDHVDAGLRFLAGKSIDAIIGVGGGSSMDCAKGINLLLTNGGKMADYRGVNHARRALLPMIVVPTTAGTGSEAQSFALISDAKTHEKMACGDRRLPSQGGLRPHAAILDPALTRTLPRHVAAVVGIDAISHAVETSGSTAADEISRAFSFEAWTRLTDAFPHAVGSDVAESHRASMLLGAHLAGAAIEASMLGAAHACANPLTARFGITHGIAVGVMLPSVIRFNTSHKPGAYALLEDDGEVLATRIEAFLRAGDLPLSAAALPVRDAIREALPDLARHAASQWTAGFNPVPVDERACEAMYRMSLDRTER